MGIILAVTGGRIATVTQEFVNTTLDLIAHENGGVDLLIHGKAKGIDSMCAYWARIRHIHAAGIEALWEELGRDVAGPRRNRAILRLKPDLVVAFPGRAGTADMIRQTCAHKIRLIKAG